MFFHALNLLYSNWFVGFFICLLDFQKYFNPLEAAIIFGVFLVVLFHAAHEKDVESDGKS